MSLQSVQADLAIRAPDLAVEVTEASTATVQLLADAEYRGRVLALQSMVFLGSAPIGGPLVGWVADVAGPRAAVAMGGVACLAAAALGQRALRERPSSRLVDTGEVALVD